MKKLNVTMVQLKILDGRVYENLKHANKVFLKNKHIIQNSHIVVLPELFATGFNHNAIKSYATKLEESQIIKHLSSVSKEYGTAIITTVPERENGKIYNTAVVVFEDTILGSYRKIHLFKMFRENMVFHGGSNIALVNVEGVRIGLAVCYDLRFPEVFRAEMLLGAQVFIIPAAWGAKRASHWKVLIRARALENQAYVIGVNRVGNGTFAHEKFAGESIAASPWGNILAKLNRDREETRLVRLNLTFLRKIRKNFPALSDVKINEYVKWYLNVRQPPPQH